jgi:hypothetical protein
MKPDNIPDNLCLAVGVDGGDICRKGVEHRSFSQSSLTLIETDQSQVGQRIKQNQTSDHLWYLYDESYK